MRKPAYYLPDRSVSDISDTSFDFTDLPGVSDTTITSAVFTVAPNDLISTGAFINGYSVSTLLSGGTAGSTYVVNCLINTANGATFLRSAIVSVI